MKKFMKQILLGAAIVMAAIGCTAADGVDGSGAVPRPTEEGVIFYAEDIYGDDNGPGTYTYPTDAVFAPGSFDLLEVKISEDGDDYLFDFTIAIPFKNEWGNEQGWDVQMFDIYLNLGEGKNTQVVAGRNVRIPEGWDKAMVVAPVGSFAMGFEIQKSMAAGYDCAESEAENIVADVKLPDAVSVRGDTVRARIAKAKMGDLSTLEGVQVFVLGSEGYPEEFHAYNRVVNANSAQWRFGGGTDVDGNPNVIDILGDNSKLGNYVSEPGRIVYTEVDLIRFAD